MAIMIGTKVGPKILVTAVIVVIILDLLGRINTAEIRYGPSISRLTGVFVNWKGPDLLDLESGSKLRLQKKGSIVLPIVSNSAVGSSQQIFDERGISTLGDFFVIAPKGYRVLATIQQLSLRTLSHASAIKRKKLAAQMKSSDVSSNNGQFINLHCSDYIQFVENMIDTKLEDEGQHVKQTDAGSIQVRRTDPICGQVKRSDSSSVPKTLTGPRSFITKGDTLKVYFNHAYVSELVGHLLIFGGGGKPKKRSTRLRLEVAFTAVPSFLNCSDAEDQLRASGDYNRTQCGSSDICLDNELFCDDTFNCPDFSDESDLQCTDENATTDSTIVPDYEDSEELSEESLNEFVIPDVSDYVVSTTSTRKPYSVSTKERKPPATKAPSSDIYVIKNYRDSYSVPDRDSFGYNKYSYIPRWRNTRYRLTSTLPPEIIPQAPSSVRPKEAGSDLQSQSSSYLESSEIQENEEIVKSELSSALYNLVYGITVFIVILVIATIVAIFTGRKLHSAFCKGLSASSGRSSRNHRSFSPTLVVLANQQQTSTNGSSGDCISSSSSTIINTSSEELPPPSYDSLFPGDNNAR